MTSDLVSSTGLPSRLGAALAYAGWWVTGAIFLFLERRDPVVRFHAAQALVAFGALALLIAAFGALALLSLSWLPAAFNVFVWLAAAAWAAGIAAWLAGMWRAASGGGWRLPVAARVAERWARAQ